MAQVYKRGKTWTVRFTKRYSVYDPETQKQISKLKQKSKGGFRTKAEATQYGIKLEAESLSGVDVTRCLCDCGRYESYCTLRLYDLS